MTIAIQTTNAALAALESLANAGNAGQSDSAAAGSSSPLLESASSDAPGSTILDVSVGAVAGLNGLTSGSASASSAVDAAVTAGDAVETLLSQLQQAAQIGSDPSLTPDQLSQLNAGFQAGLSQIQQTVAGASVDGANLLNGQSPANSPVTLTAYDLSLGGSLITVGADASLSDPDTAASLATQLGQSAQNVSQAVGQIAAQGQAIQDHLTLVAQASSAPGSGSVAINSSLDGDGARLQALQVQQQLAGANQSISNQSPQSILALFAG